MQNLTAVLIMCGLPCVWTGLVIWGTWYLTKYGFPLVISRRSRAAKNGADPRLVLKRSGPEGPH